MIQVLIGFPLDVCSINYSKGMFTFHCQTRHDQADAQISTDRSIMFVSLFFNRHSPFRQHKTKDKHEIDKMTMTMVK